MNKTHNTDDVESHTITASAADIPEEAARHRPAPMMTASEAARRRMSEVPAAQSITDPLSLIDRAIQRGVDPDTLSKLMDLQERHEQMQERARTRAAEEAFNESIATAKAAFRPIRKGGHVHYESDKGKSTDFRHGRLQDVEEAVGPVLASHGLSYRFETSQGDGGVIVTCILSHREGHHVRNTLKGAPDSSGSKNSYQALGSAITYLMRITLVSALGLSFADDDDAMAAQGRSDDAPPAEPADEDAVAKLRDRIKKVGVKEEAILTAYKVKSLDEMTAPTVERAMKRLAATAEKRGVDLGEAG